MDPHTSHRLDLEARMSYSTEKSITNMLMMECFSEDQARKSCIWNNKISIVASPILPFYTGN